MFHVVFSANVHFRKEKLTDPYWPRGQGHMIDGEFCVQAWRPHLRKDIDQL